MKKKFRLTYVIDVETDLETLPQEALDRFSNRVQDSDTDHFDVTALRLSSTQEIPRDRFAPDPSAT